MISFPSLGKVGEAYGRQEVQTPSLPLVTAVHVTLKKSLHLFMSLSLHSQNEEDCIFLEGRKKEGS